MGFFSGGKSTSTAESFSGLRGIQGGKPLREVVSGIPTAFNFGLDYSKNLLNDTNPYQLQDNGLTAPQLSAFRTLGDQLFSNESGRYASRGLLSPENAGAISGSALTQLAPQLLGQVFANQQANQQAKTDRFAMLKSLLDTGTGLLGQQSKATSTTTGPNMLGSALAGSIGNLVTSAGNQLMSGGAGSFKIFG